MIDLVNSYILYSWHNRLRMSLIHGSLIFFLAYVFVWPLEQVIGRQTFFIAVTIGLVLLVDFGRGLWNIFRVAVIVSIFALIHSLFVLLNPVITIMAVFTFVASLFFWYELIQKPADRTLKEYLDSLKAKK